MTARDRAIEAIELVKRGVYSSEYPTGGAVLDAITAYVMSKIPPSEGAKAGTDSKGGGATGGISGRDSQSTTLARGGVPASGGATPAGDRRTLQELEARARKNPLPTSVLASSGERREVTSGALTPTRASQLRADCSGEQCSELFDEDEEMRCDRQSDHDGLHSWSEATRMTLEGDDHEPPR